MLKEQQELPNEWTFQKLESLLERMSNGLSLKQSPEPPGLPVTRIETISNGVIDMEKVKYLRDLPDEKIEKYTLKKGDILFSHINSDLHLGKTALVGKETGLIHGMNLLLMRFNSSVKPKYMHYLLNMLRTKGFFISIAQHAVNQSSLNQRKLNGIELPIAPLNQQKQIVAKIEELFSHIDAGIESLKTAKHKLKQYRQSVLKAAVTGELTKEWREQNANAEQGCSNVAGGTTPGATKIEPANQLLKRIQTERRQRWEQQKLAEFQAKGKPPKNDKWKEKYKEPEVLENIGLKIPETWETISFEQLGQWSGGGTPSKSKPEFWSGGEILWITPKDMKSDFLEDSIDKITSVAVKKSTAKLITEDSLLFVVRSGILRRILPVGLTRKKATVNQDIKALTFSISDVAEYFLICSKALEEQIRRKCMKGGTTVESVEVPRLLNFVLPLPSLKEQKEIVQRVEGKLIAADRLMAELDTKLTQAQQQKQTILASAFKGELVNAS